MACECRLSREKQSEEVTEGQTDRRTEGRGEQSTPTPATYLLLQRATWCGKWSSTNGGAGRDEIHVCCSARLKSLFSAFTEGCGMMGNRSRE